MNGDGIADLVVTYGCGVDTTDGSDHWNVHLGSATGFATTPTAWALPSLYGTSKFSNGVSWDNGCSPLSYDTLDMTGDGIADLVVTYGCGVDATDGSDHWNVYVGTCP
jgi:hypothetical protein